MRKAAPSELPPEWNPEIACRKLSKTYKLSQQPGDAQGQVQRARDEK